ncbi:MAG TPA: DUF4012 domain-containing protein, partial [Euzebya sp.]|nr:DUF4012 domain-containing protein [Euzebya sp.]
AYTLLEVDGGQLSFGEFVTTTTIGGVTVDAPPPTEEFGRRYEPYGSAGLLSTVNYSADLPTVSQAILNIYEHVEGERLDGVILADAHVLEALVRATGPVDIPQVGLVPASEIVATLSNDAYDALPDSNARKALLGQVAAATLEGFLQRGAASDPVRAARVLVEAGGRGHLQMFSADPEEQAALLETGLSGSLMTPPDPDAVADVTMGVFSNNTGANKTDFYTDRVVEVDMQLLPNGGAVATVAVTHTNDTPTSELPVDVIGPNTEDVGVGENRLVTSLWCRGGCQLIGAGRDGADVGLTADVEAGFDVFTINQLLQPGGEETITFDLLLPTMAADGEMSLRFANQASVNPTRLRVDVTVPEGQEVHDRGDFVQAAGFWTWQQLPGPVQDLSLTVGPPDDLWSRTLRLLTTRL